MDDEKLSTSFNESKYSLEYFFGVFCLLLLLPTIILAYGEFRDIIDSKKYAELNAHPSGEAFKKLPLELKEAIPLLDVDAFSPRISIILRHAAGSPAITDSLGVLIRIK